jgi:hypothetical protein
MVAGMTPTTCNPNVVAATLNAGYHGELAGGGLPREHIFRDALNRLLVATDPGNGVTFNLLFLNPRLWSFQAWISVFSSSVTDRLLFLLTIHSFPWFCAWPVLVCPLMVLQWQQAYHR